MLHFYHNYLRGIKMANSETLAMLKDEIKHILDFFETNRLKKDKKNNEVGVAVNEKTALMVKNNGSPVDMAVKIREKQLRYVYTYIKRKLKEVGIKPEEIKGGVSNLTVVRDGEVIFKFKIGTRTAPTLVATKYVKDNPKSAVLLYVDAAIYQMVDELGSNTPEPTKVEEETVVEYPENATLFNALKDASLKDEPEEQPLQKQIITKLDNNVDVGQRTRVSEIQEWISSVPQNLLLDTPIYENDEGEQWYLNEDLHGLIYQVLTLRNPDLRDHLSLKGNLLEYRIFDTARVSYELNIETLFSLYKMIDPAIDMIHNYLVSAGDRKVASRNIDILQKQNIAILSDRRSHSIRVEGLVIIRQELANILDNAELNDLSLEDVLIDIEESLPMLLEKIDSLNINQSRHSMRRRQAELDRWDESERSPRRL